MVTPQRGKVRGKICRKAHQLVF
uniref:Uncharacterized protein n=1 Tax=Anguilla anguilla TaxID=7936 RepID=A0A0E9U7P8_ANGAN